MDLPDTNMQPQPPTAVVYNKTTPSKWEKCWQTIKQQIHYPEKWWVQKYKWEKTKEKENSYTEKDIITKSSENQLQPTKGTSYYK